MNVRREYFQEIVEPTEEEQFFESLAAEYHLRCDAFDLRVCSAKSPRSGEPIPAGWWESAQVNKNARKVLNELTARASGRREALLRAIRRFP